MEKGFNPARESSTLKYSRYVKADNRRKSQGHQLEFKESGIMPGAYSTMKNTGIRERSFAIGSPGKFNPLGKESPLMRVDRTLPAVRTSNSTMSRFYSTGRAHEAVEGLVNLKTTSIRDNTEVEVHSTVNVKGKLKSLEQEILEVNQVMNFHK